MLESLLIFSAAKLQQILLGGNKPTRIAHAGKLVEAEQVSNN